MFLRERSVSFISLAGHQSMLERHEQDFINQQLAGVHGFDVIQDILSVFKLKLGSKINDNKYHLLRLDDTKITNAYIEGNHEKMVVKMLKPFSFKHLAKDPSAIFNPSMDIEREELED